MPGDGPLVLAARALTAPCRAAAPPRRRPRRRDEPQARRVDQQRAAGERHQLAPHRGVAAAVVARADRPGRLPLLAEQGVEQRRLPDARRAEQHRGAAGREQRADRVDAAAVERADRQHGVPSSPAATPSATAAGSSARSALVSSTTASTSPRALTARNRASRRGLRSRFAEVASSARSTLAASTSGRPPSPRRAMTPRRGSTARTGPSGSTPTKSPVCGHGPQAPGERGAPRPVAGVDDHAAAVDGQTLAGTRSGRPGSIWSAAPRASQGARGDDRTTERLLQRSTGRGKGHGRLCGRGPTQRASR